MSASKLMPGTHFPNIVLPVVGCEPQVIGKTQKVDAWKLVILYRSAFCPLGTTYLKQVQSFYEEILAGGTEVIAVSTDLKEKAELYAEENSFSFPIAYDLSEEHMKSLGLYVSEPRSASEGDRPFSEPGLFIITPEGMVQVVEISNAPFARSDLTVIKQSLEYIKQPPDKRYDSFGTARYPIRGTHIS